MSKGDLNVATNLLFDDSEKVFTRVEQDKAKEEQIKAKKIQEMIERKEKLVALEKRYF